MIVKVEVFEVDGNANGLVSLVYPILGCIFASRNVHWRFFHVSQIFKAASERRWNVRA